MFEAGDGVRLAFLTDRTCPSPTNIIFTGHNCRSCVSISYLFANLRGPHRTVNNMSREHFISESYCLQDRFIAQTLSS